MKDKVVIFTKIVVEIMYYGGMFVTITLPYTVKWAGNYIPHYLDHYHELVATYCMLGILAILLLRELRKMMKTVMLDECFVTENVVSLQKMSSYSFLIICVSLVRTFVYITPAMLVVILVFCIAGLFSRVLSMVFERAIHYKQETDYTV
ncbi:MAG: DUF2975 domain-containing protein [Eubacteriales bacterium]